jgi:3-oxoacyl-[acyl-carrier protein] reductase
LSQDYRRVALVSDGSRGIGAATVRRLAAAGWDVSFCHRGDEQAVRQVEKAVSELGGRVLAVEVDVTDAAGVTSWFQRAQDELGPVQAAVSCAGMTRDQPLARLEDADWRAVLDTGLDGMFHICRAAMFAMMKRRSGRIVAVSSVCGAYQHWPADDRPAHDRPTHHWPVRAGIAGFVPALSALTSRFGVSVNAVTPGPATHDMTAILPELTRADLTETVALRRFDDPSDVAELVAFLLSAACETTGRVLEVRSPISLLTQVSDTQASAAGYPAFTDPRHRAAPPAGHHDGSGSNLGMIATAAPVTEWMISAPPSDSRPISIV